MSEPSAPAQPPAQGAHRGRGSRGGGRGKGGVNTDSNASQASSNQQAGMRFSALGNPLPPTKESAQASGNAAEQAPPPRVTAPPSVMRSNSLNSAASSGTNTSERGNRGSGDRRRGSGRGNGNVGAPASGAESSAPVKWPNAPTRAANVPSVTRQSSMTSTTSEGSVMPDILSAGNNWGDAEGEDSTPDVVEARLRTQLERSRSDKTTLQKQLTELQTSLDQAKKDSEAKKAEADQLRTQIDKATMMEKSYTILRQTRDTLETERDNLKKNFAKLEKDFKLLKEDSEKEVTKLKIAAEALNAQIEYQKLELEEYRTGGAPPPSASSWLMACLAGMSREKIADRLDFSALEVAVVNVALWEAGDESGFKQSICTLAFERGNEKLNPAAPSFSQDAMDAFSRIMAGSDMLLFVPNRSPAFPAARYESFVSRFAEIIAAARDASKGSAKKFGVVLEDYPLNRMAVDQGRRLVPVSFLSPH